MPHHRGQFSEGKRRAGASAKLDRDKARCGPVTRSGAASEKTMCTSATIRALCMAQPSLLVQVRTRIDPAAAPYMRV